MKKKTTFYGLFKNDVNRNYKKEVYDKLYNKTFIIVSVKFEEYPEAIPDKLFDKWWNGTLKGLINTL